MPKGRDIIPADFSLLTSMPCRVRASGKEKTDAHRVPGGNRSASVCRYELCQIVPFISGFQPFTESFTCFYSGLNHIRKADLRNNAITTSRMTRKMVHEEQSGGKTEYFPLFVFS